MAQQGATADKDLFGHPRGLTVLATTEMWERFSFFGMQALLMLYMTKYLLLPEHARDVLGLAAFRSGLASVVGPMTDLAFAAQTYGIYSGLIYGTPLLGAWLGDRVIGKTRAITAGCVLMSVGHLAMAVESLFITALALIVLGAGGVVGNMAAQVGQLYETADQRRTRAFGVYLITLNIGALIAPLVIGTLGEKVGWHWGFGAAGIGMLIGLVTYLAGRKHLPPDRIIPRAERVRLTSSEWRRVWGIMLLLVPYLLYNTAAYQAYGIMFVWADTAVDRVVLGWEVPVTWIGVIDGLLTILGVVIANRIWMTLARRNREPRDKTKMILGYFGVASAFLFAAAIATLPLVPLLAWVVFFIIFDFSFGWIEPPVQATISREAPPSINATMMSIMKASSMLAYFALGWLGRFYEPMGAPLYWLLTAAIAGSAALFLLLFGKMIVGMLGADEG